jgi:DNA-binding NarL/FixJ family response regulator
MDGLARFVGRTVLIADTQPVFRLGLVALLASAHPEWDVIETDTLEESRARPQARPIDLLILARRLLAVELDRGGPQLMCLNLAREVIAVTEPGDTISALGCLAAGAHATISRADPANQILATIETIMNRRQQQQIVPQQAMVSTEASHEPNLTNRQLDVLRLLAKGQSNKVIARDLGLSVSTVKVHLNTVFRALGASNRVEAVVRARPLHTRMAPQNH